VRTIRHYNNGTILTPHKCGTKYLNKVFNVSRQENVISLKDLHQFDFKWLIVRDPYEHLLSALTTVYNTKQSTRNLKDTLDRFIKGLDVHWQHGHHKDILSYSSNHSLTLVNISDLTPFVENELKLVAPPMLSRYCTEIIYLSKEGLVDKIKTEYPSEWDTLMELVDTERVHYDLLFGKCGVYSSEFSYS
jgi:hypothetical protein